MRENCFWAAVAALALLVVLSGCGGGGPVSTGGGGHGGSGAGPGGGAPPPVTPRPFPGDYYTRLDAHRVRAQPSALILDEAAGQVYVADTVNNDVSVLAETDAHLLATIFVPAPLGMDIGADGKVYVGSATGAFFVLNPATLHSVERVALPAGLREQGVPAQPFGMADGNVFWAIGAVDPSGQYALQALVLWHPDTGQFDAPLPDPNPNLRGYDGMPVLTGNRSELLVPAGGLYLYSEPKASFIAQSPPAPNAQMIAAAPDGSQVALETVQVGNPTTATLQLYDASLQPEGAALAVTPPQGLGYKPIYSADGSLLYVNDNGGTITGVSAATGKIAGYFRAIVETSVAPVEPVIASDDNGNLWGIAGAGVFKAAVHLQSAPFPVLQAPIDIMCNALNSPPAGGLTDTCFGIALSTPDSGGIADSMQIYFDATAGINQSVADVSGSNTLTATVPAAAAEGPVTVLLTDANGNAVFLPEGTTYGVQLLNIAPNVVGPLGGDYTMLSGLGFSEANVVDARVAIDGVPAALNNAGANSNSSGYPEHTLTFTVPPHVPGWQSVTITGDDGEDTMPLGLQYAQQESVVANPGYGYAVYDAQKDLFYLSGLNIGVFDAKRGTFDAPLATAGSSCTHGYGPEAIAPDGSYLVAACGGGVAVINLSDPTASQYVALPLGSQGTAGAIAISSQDNAFIVPTSDDCPGTTAVPLVELGLATLSVRTRTDSAPTCGYYATAVASGDGNKLLFETSGGLTSAGLWSYDATSDTFTSMTPPTTTGMLSLDGDGGVAEVGGAIVDAQWQPWAPLPNGGVLNATGSLAIESDAITDTHDGRQLLSLSAELLNGTMSKQDGPVTISPDGSEILTLSQQTINYLKLATVPLAVGTVTPAAGVAGAVISVAGSGFEAGLTATLGGAAMACTVQDAEHLSCTVPAGLTAGEVPMTLSNPDGQTYSFELAFAVQ